MTPTRAAEKYAEGPRPLCLCHGEEMLWATNWRCPIKQRASRNVRQARYPSTGRGQLKEALGSYRRHRRARMVRLDAQAEALGLPPLRERTEAERDADREIYARMTRSRPMTEAERDAYDPRWRTRV
jgi:hypothetical protein